MDILDDVIHSIAEEEEKIRAETHSICFSSR